VAIEIEGMSADEILALPEEHLDVLILTGKPIVFRVGSAQLLGEFRVSDEVLSIDLAHIDGGGEGALPAIAAISQRFARARGLTQIEWLVRATNCAKPNPKLRRILERRGFQVQDVPGRGECYYQKVRVVGNQPPN
jgi:hypothetical protein